MNLPELYGRFAHTVSSKEIFYDWEGANSWLFQQIYSIREAGYDIVMQTVSNAARYSLFPYYLVALIVIVIFMYLTRKLRNKGGTKQFISMWFGIFSVLIAAFIANELLLKIVKDYFAYPRPFVALDHIQPLDEHITTGSDYESFPSGHVAFATVMVIGLWPGLSHRMKILGMLLIALVAWSRVSLGVHFPADTFYAFLMATLVVIIVREIIYGIYHKVFGLNC